jgi:aspartate/methionine/tyrosine aminotransferase
MFEIRDALAAYRAAYPGDPVYDASQGDGGASLPGVPAEILDAAHRMVVDHGTAYDPPAGTPEFREAIAQRYWELTARSGFGPSNVLACQGGRDGLLKAYDAVLGLGHRRRGDFILTSAVPWISYTWGPYSMGANVLRAPGQADRGWAIEPDALGDCVKVAARLDRRIAALVITSPDNPTGRTLADAEQLTLIRRAFAVGIPFVILDWMYHRVTEGAPTSLDRMLGELAPEERDRCLVLDGITKSLGASGVRSAHLVASEAVVAHMARRASHGVLPGYHGQAVTLAAIEAGFARVASTINGPTSESRAVVRQWIADRGLRHVIGSGYYAFVEVGDVLEGAGLADTARLSPLLGERYGVAVVPGATFSPAGARWLRISYALPPRVTEAALTRLGRGLDEIRSGG